MNSATSFCDTILDKLGCRAAFLIATPKRRLTLLPLALMGAFSVGLGLSLSGSFLASYNLPNVGAAGETNVLNPASYNATSDFYQQRTFRFEVDEANGGRGTATITVDPANNGIARQVD